MNFVSISIVSVTITWLCSRQCCISRGILPKGGMCTDMLNSHKGTKRRIKEVLQNPKVKFHESPSDVSDFVKTAWDISHFFVNETISSMCKWDTSQTMRELCRRFHGFQSKKHNNKAWENWGWMSLQNGYHEIILIKCCRWHPKTFVDGFHMFGVKFWCKNGCNGETSFYQHYIPVYIYYIIMYI